MRSQDNFVHTTLLNLIVSATSPPPLSFLDFSLATWKDKELHYDRLSDKNFRTGVQLSKPFAATPLPEVFPGKFHHGVLSAQEDAAVCLRVGQITKTILKDETYLARCISCVQSPLIWRVCCATIDHYIPTGFLLNLTGCISVTSIQPEYPSLNVCVCACYIGFQRLVNGVTREIVMLFLNANGK